MINGTRLMPLPTNIGTKHRLPSGNGGEKELPSTEQQGNNSSSTSTSKRIEWRHGKRNSCIRHITGQEKEVDKHKDGQRKKEKWQRCVKQRRSDNTSGTLCYAAECARKVDYMYTPKNFWESNNHTNWTRTTAWAQVSIVAPTNTNGYTMLPHRVTRSFSLLADIYSETLLASVIHSLLVFTTFQMAFEECFFLFTPDFQRTAPK